MMELRIIDEELRKAKEDAIPKAVPAQPELPLDPELGGRYAEPNPVRRPV